jgi:hypothetical protein
VYGPTAITTTQTINPGIYQGGITINCASCTITFAAGMYIMAGGGISATSASKLVGTGVTIFNTLQNYPTETGTCGPMTFGGSSEIQLSAPTTGFFTGMLIFVDPTCNQGVSLTGTSQLETENGAIYAASSLVTMSSGTQMQIGGQIIADRITIGNTAQLQLTFNPVTTARAQFPSLVE